MTDNNHPKFKEDKQDYSINDELENAKDSSINDNITPGPLNNTIKYIYTDSQHKILFVEQYDCLQRLTKATPFIDMHSFLLVGMAVMSGVTIDLQTVIDMED